MNIDEASDGPGPAPLAAPNVLPIGELARRVALALERSFALQWVAGEVSNLTRAASGHWYFSLKDRDAQVRSVMFRNRNQSVDWPLRDGDRVEARVVVGLYVPRGEFQLQVEQLRRAGAGALYEQFLRIKAALESAGLFAAARKRPLPAHPRTIGVVTSLQAAALRDVLTTLARRAPHVAVIVFPTPVQGSDAPQRIVDAIVAAAHPDAEGRTKHGVDVLLVVRGGGSIEDLWAFNDERVAHAIAGAVVPVVSGVGHETDFTIADFTADVRAPTPTAAAELASPDATALLVRLGQHRGGLGRAFERAMNTRAQRVDEAARRLRSPQQRLDAATERLATATRRLARAQATALAEAGLALSHARALLRTPDLRTRVARLALLRDGLGRAMQGRLDDVARMLDHRRRQLILLDPKGILRRGYAIATDDEGRVVSDAATLVPGQRVSVEVARGRFVSDVVERSPE